MRDRMAHRGPDGVGLWSSSDRSCTLGHRRLAIIDLSDAAAQPMLNAAGTVAVTFNGEIYNHAELRQKLVALGKYQWRTDHRTTETAAEIVEYDHPMTRCDELQHDVAADVAGAARDQDRSCIHASDFRRLSGPCHAVVAGAGSRDGIGKAWKPRIMRPCPSKESRKAPATPSPELRFIILAVQGEAGKASPAPDACRGTQVHVWNRRRDRGP